jgi:hypothetical protein
MGVRDEFGSLTPANVVESARDEESPLHHRFEWDDTIAAERFREVQASELIRKVKITYADANGSPQVVRAFLVVRGDGPNQSVYEPTEEVMSDPFASKLLLQEFEREWRAFKSKYDHLKEFAGTIAAHIAA